MNTRAALAMVTITIGGVGCAQPPAPPPAPRAATAVDAAFGVVWEAAIDHFAEGNVPISAIERASGLITTSSLRVDLETAMESSDCGVKGGIEATHMYARTAVYNVLVRGDEQSATVRVTASWMNADATFPCVTTGVWEGATELAIKERAEAGVS